MTSRHKLPQDWSVNTDYDVPEHLQKLIDQEYQEWLKREARSAKDAKAKFSIQAQPKEMDTISLGSLGTRFGAQFALPFYARFQNHEEAERYCKTHLEPFEHGGKVACILWDSPLGKHLISTLVMSPDAWRFVISRDLWTRRSYWSFATPALTWVTFSFFASALVLLIHQKLLRNGGFVAFFTIYAVCMVMLVLLWREWDKLREHFCNSNSDTLSAELSLAHANGAREYYMKLLKRNRLLQEVLPEGDDLFTLIGDVKGAVTPYRGRLENVLHHQSEREDFAVGDDW
ncbi:hypothetical protein AAVH_09298 [Aphelenchoides avenae]|nr:hypothetical protein AAVH_09298 [Aphelenchus avenae]